jgi:acetylornithine/N-succinyldiaminopimelate aminotransferase
MQNSIIPLYRQIDALIVKGKDCHLFDANGRRYIDFESGDWAACLGHSNDRISRVLKIQADTLIHDGLRFRNTQSEDLSARLLKLLSFTDGESVFLNSGSEAVNLAITIARNLSGRGKILKMDCSFLSSYGYGQISENNTDLISIPMDDMNALSEIDFKAIAAFAFEPGNARGLIKFPTNEFIQSIASAVKQNNGFLIANEVTTGFGRTGKWFGFQHYDFHPDIVSMGKGLGNGYPVSCVSITRDVAALFDGKPFRYAQSHQNDPLGCAVGFEVINAFEEMDLIQRSSDMGRHFAGELVGLKAKHGGKIKDIRARGLMLALELDSSIKAEKIYMQLIENGLLVGWRENVLRFMPPLVIEKSHIDKLIQTIDRLLAGEIPLRS